MDLSSLNVAELQSLQRDITAQIELRKQAERNNVLAQITQLAEQSGFGLEELLEAQKQRKGKVGKGTGRTAAPKFRHPEDAEITWSGRGKPPRWFKAYTEAGNDADSLLIK